MIFSGFFSSFLIFLMMLVSMSFFTLLERKVLGYIQLRKGPNKVGFIGLLQPFSDAIKLFSKEINLPHRSNIFSFIIFPFIRLILSLLLWFIYPIRRSVYIISFRILFFLCISSIRVYCILGSGWSSNSKYSLLGSLRRIAQTISYEVRITLILLRCLILKNSVRFNYIYYEIFIGYFFLFIPLYFIWFTSILAETNRTPFDFSEGESELVRGFNTEYRAFSFALIFMSEYLNILIISLLRSLIFMPFLYFGVLKDFLLILYTLFFSFVFIWVRGRFPRFRYDQLMNLTWKTFLPFSLGIIFFIFGAYFFI